MNHPHLNCHIHSVCLQAKSLQKGSSKTPTKSSSEPQKSATKTHSKESKQTGGGDLLENLAMTAMNTKDERSKTGWRYRRKAQEKRHQKRKSSKFKYKHYAVHVCTIVE